MKRLEVNNVHEKQRVSSREKKSLRMKRVAGD